VSRVPNEASLTKRQPSYALWFPPPNLLSPVVQGVRAGGHDPVIARQARARRGRGTTCSAALLLAPRHAGGGVEGRRDDDTAAGTVWRRRAMMGRSRKHRHAAGSQEHEECEARRPPSSTHGRWCEWPQGAERNDCSGVARERGKYVQNVEWSST
jgi:hypothetical protein